MGESHDLKGIVEGLAFKGVSQKSAQESHDRFMERLLAEDWAGALRELDGGAIVRPSGSLFAAPKALWLVARENPPLDPQGGGFKGAPEGLSLARALMDRGFDSAGGGEEPDFFSPLLRAAYAGNRALCQLFLLRGADPNTRSATGMTALDLVAVSERFDVELAVDFLRAGADGELFAKHPLMSPHAEGARGQQIKAAMEALAQQSELERGLPRAHCPSRGRGL